MRNNASIVIKPNIQKNQNFSVKPSCFVNFQERCKSKRTFQHYTKNLDYFLKFAHKDYDSILLVTEIEINQILQDFTIFLKRRAEK